MAITSFTELKTAAANWLGRDDLTARIPEFIALAESRINRVVSARAQEKRAVATLTSGDSYVALPTDLRSIRSVVLDTSPVTVLRYMAADVLEQNHPSSTSGKPRAYTVIGAEIKFGPQPDDAYVAQIVYDEGIAALSDTNATNDYLTRFPDLYLYGSLAEAHHYLMDETNAQSYDALFSRAMEEVRREDETVRWGGTGLQMESDNQPVES